MIDAGHIAPGDVDERSIEDVRPDDLRGYTHCHFFAGIGGWSIALRLTGWPDDRPVWTGSCPCQPFSAAGKGAGFDDERHLWPFWHWLISERRPPIIFGEQVASKDVEPWIDLVSTDLEGLGYAFGADPFPSAGVGAPHIRDRAYFVADSDCARSQRRRGVRQRRGQRAARPSGLVGRLAHDHGRTAQASGGLRDDEHNAQSRSGTRGMADTHIGVSGQGRAIDGGRDSRSDAIARARFGGDGDAHELADAMRSGSLPGSFTSVHRREEGSGPRNGESERCSSDGGAGPTNGFWRVADWLFCRDEKWRPVEPGTSPLVAGLPAGMGKLSPELRRLAELASLDGASLKRAKAYRVGTLRGYGNAINVEAAAEFIRASREAIDLTA
nr:DNA cytosine methyltransferase [Paraburkholderia sp. Ac-20342]